jgi:hypothetical protein
MVRLLLQSGEPTKLSSSAALLDTRGNRGPGAGSRFPRCRSAVKLVVSAERRWMPCTTTGRQDAALVQLSGDSTGPANLRQRMSDYITGLGRIRAGLPDVFETMHQGHFLRNSSQ